MFCVGPIFSHNATTYGGSSGCPIFREYQERWVIVGLHRAELEQKSVAYTNLATHISAVYGVCMDIPYSGRGKLLSILINPGIYFTVCIMCEESELLCYKLHFIHSLSSG